MADVWLERAIGLALILAALLMLQPILLGALAYRPQGHRSIVERV